MTEIAVKTLFCIGLGYSARALALRLSARGWRIRGTCNSAESEAALTAEGFSVSRVSRDRPPSDAQADLEGVTHLLSSVPPDAEGDPALAAYGAAIAARQQNAAFEWIGYLSTTGVYGNRDGGWVDEQSPLQPSGERGRRRVAAEAAWLDFWKFYAAPVHLFRLAGIYGPGRSAFESLRNGTARRVVKTGQVFSRIHVEDIATILEASILHPEPGTAYNVCDDDPAPPDEVIAYAAELLGIEPLPLIPFETAALSPMARSFYDDNKRVSNRRLQERLGVALAYPDYRMGLRAILKSAYELF